MGTQYTIFNESFTATIDAHGAELKSLKSNKTGTEYLWCADPTVWGKTAPILFPYIGMVRDSYIKVDEQVFPMTKHGFARNAEFQLTNQSPTLLTFEMTDGDTTRGLYPYSFVFRVTYELTDRMLDTRFEVINKSDKTMHFALGGHTGFSTEIAGSKIGDYSLEFECDSELISEAVDMRLGLLTNEKINCGKGRVLQLSVPTFHNDALVFLDVKPKSVKIKSRKHNTIVRVDYKDFPNVAVWSAKGSDRFVCIEPWISNTDTVTTRHTLAKKPGFVSLNKGKEYRASFQITVTE